MLLQVVAGTAVWQPCVRCLCWAPMWRPLIGRDAAGATAGDGCGPLMELGADAEALDPTLFIAALTC